MKLQFEINQPAELIFDYLSDMQKFVTVHPVINKIDNNHNILYDIYKMMDQTQDYIRNSLFPH